MNDRQRELADQYAVALASYLSEPEEPALARAHELGRNALTERLGVLEMGVAHSRALAGVLSRPLTDEERARTLEALEKFFIEALSPFEMAHRGFWDANVVLHRLNDVLEGQAKRIASRLHDDAGQLLASVHFTLADVASGLPIERAREIQAARRLLDQIEDRLRNLAHELRPPVLDDLGLVPALEFLAERVSKRWGLPVQVRASIVRSLPATVETTLYRITQEALTNVAKHAKATHAEVLIHDGAHHVACSIRDDGTGINASVLEPCKNARGIGLREMQERVAALGGVLRLGSNAPRGADVTVEIPLESRGA